MKTDPKRVFAGAHTGICVRAQKPDGSYASVDVAELDGPSLLAWLRSRGGENPWAENTVALLLGHKENIA